MDERSIIVGYDGSPAAEAALAWALAEGRRTAAGVRLVFAFHWPTPLVAEPVGWALTARRDAGAMVTAAARAATTADTPVTGDLVDGPPALVLGELSRTARLVVVGDRGLGGFAHLLVGSTSATLAAHAHCPVVVVRGGPQQDSAPVVVGVDGSTGSLTALRFALERAAERDAAVRVVQALTPPEARWQPAAFDLEDVRSTARAALEATLRPLREEFGGVKVGTELVVGGASDVLVQASRDAQLLVVGTRGHGVITGVLLGSVSQQVLHHSHCPVVVTRPTTVG